MDVQPEKGMRGKVTLADLVYESIRDAIVHERVKPKERLNQLALAREFDVSERTVREALTRLISEGLVIRDPYREFRVVGLSVDETEEIFRMRALLEGWAVELAAREITREELDQMRRLLSKMAAGTPTKSASSLKKTHFEFHWIAIEASRKKYLIQTLRRLWDLSLRHTFSENDPERLAQQLRKGQVYHAKLVEALEAGEGEKARGLLVAHIDEAITGIRA